MPGYEPFLLCDFHVHTTWSDGKLSVAEVVDLYGATGKFDVLERIGGFDTNIEFHGEDTNLGRRIAAVGHVRLARECYMFTSARRYNAMGKGAVFGLYIRNFWSEILRHRPSDGSHLDVRS